jgi:hypothetical protein
MGIERSASKRNVQYIQQNNNRKFPKSRENYVHSGPGSLQNKKDLTKIELPNNILLLEQQAQRLEKEY